jgi:hypothetical protein
MPLRPEDSIVRFSQGLGRKIHSMYKPDQFESISSSISKADHRWSWDCRGISAVLNENGRVISLVVDPNLTPVAIDGKSVRSAKDLSLTQFTNSTKSDDLFDLTLGDWQVEFAFQPKRKGKKTKPYSGQIKLVTVRSR